MRLRDHLERQQLAAYPWRFEHRLAFSDMDAFRHLNNVAIARLFEEGRASMNVECFGNERMINPVGGPPLMLVSVAIEYLAQGYYPGTVQVGSGILRLGGSSWTLAQAAFQGERCIAMGESVMVKAAQDRASPLDELERARLSQWLLQPA